MSVLLDIRGLEVSYGELRAVERLDLTIRRGETVALVGESGCGKSTSALAAMGLLPRVARVRGEALFEGRDLLTLAESELRALRGGAISMVFQDSATALNPVLSVGRQIVETLELHTPLRGAAARSRAIELLELVEIPRAGERIDHFPHQFSGGQRQRVAIAMAVACSPRLLIADEPTTALDVAIQGKILELLDRLKTEIGMGLLLITHDLALVSPQAGGGADRAHPQRLHPSLYQRAAGRRHRHRQRPALPHQPPRAGGAALRRSGRAAVSDAPLRNPAQTRSRGCGSAVAAIGRARALPAGPPAGERAAGRGSGHRAGRDAGAGGGIGLRQVHPVAGDHAAAAGFLGQHPF